MKKITLLATLLISAASFAQIASTSFEEPTVFGGQYTDTGDPAVAHDLVNNTDEPILNFTGGTELGYSASYTPYDTPDVGLTDGDFVGVTDFTPSGDVLYTDGVQGYQISDADGNFILEFDQVDLSGIPTPSVSIDFVLSINGDGTNGNYEGDGTVNESGSDRLRIYVRDITNSTEIDLFNSTGSDLDDLVPTDGGLYILEWQTASANLPADITAQLVIEARMNAGGEAIFFDNVVFDGDLGVTQQTANAFSVYPNPATNQVTIESQLSGNKEVQIFDVLGKKVLSTSLTTNQLDITALHSGVYVIQITQEGVTSTQKLIVR